MFYEILTPVDLCIESYTNRYIFRKVYATDVLFSPHHFSMYKYISVFCTSTGQRYKVRAPL